MPSLFGEVFNYDCVNQITDRDMFFLGLSPELLHGLRRKCNGAFTTCVRHFSTSCAIISPGECRVKMGLTNCQICCIMSVMGMPTTYPFCPMAFAIGTFFANIQPNHLYTAYWSAVNFRGKNLCNVPLPHIVKCA